MAAGIDGISQEAALEAGKQIYAREILNHLDVAGCYCAESLQRQRLLLLGRAGDSRVASYLPSLDEELLLRARGALAQGNGDRGIRLLMAAEDQQSSTWNLLMGHLRMEQKEYAAASGYLIRAEQEFPGETAPLLEVCFRELGDYPKAYEYACKQKG